jgi:hypothetical protein
LDKLRGVVTDEFVKVEGSGRGLFLSYQPSIRKGSQKEQYYVS